MVIRPKSIATVVVVFDSTPGDVVDVESGVGQHLFGTQGCDLADCRHHRGLADTEVPGDEDLDSRRQAGAGPAAAREIGAHA
jgi:hypothetical protein